MSTVEYEGLREHAGWRFTLAPESNTAGSPGYAMHQVRPSDSIREWANREPDHPMGMSVADKTSFVARMTDTWCEESWLTEWLRHGLIRVVKPVTP